MSRRLLYLLLVLILAGALLFTQLPIVPTYAGRTVENAGHLPLFFLVTLALLYALRAWRPFRAGPIREGKSHAGWLYLFAGVAGLGLGLASEVLQRSLGRDASWEDVFADAVGVVCALAVFSLFDRGAGLRGWRRAVPVAVILTGATYFLWPIANMTRAYLHRDGQFPVLADFRSPVELSWTVSFGVRREIVSGALQVDFVADEFPGVSFHEPVPDWRGFRTLLIDVENPSDMPLALGLRVHDIGHGRQFNDRFNRHFTLAAGERRRLSIDLEDIRHGPTTRLVDMARISDITLFRGKDGGSRRLLLHGMRLE